LQFSYGSVPQLRSRQTEQPSVFADRLRGFAFRLFLRDQLIGEHAEGIADVGGFSGLLAAPHLDGVYPFGDKRARLRSLRAGLPGAYLRPWADRVSPLLAIEKVGQPPHGAGPKREASAVGELAREPTIGGQRGPNLRVGEHMSRPPVRRV
jgi:hypothetical protein